LFLFFLFLFFFFKSLFTYVYFCLNSQQISLKYDAVTIFLPLYNSPPVGPIAQSV
jgi:hypothetical protein